jgi:hypothetical protein
VYEIDYDAGRCPEYQFWDGTGWIYGTDSIDGTARIAVTSNDYRTAPHRWRGILDFSTTTEYAKYCWQCGTKLKKPSKSPLDETYEQLELAIAYALGEKK